MNNESTHATTATENQQHQDECNAALRAAPAGFDLPAMPPPWRKYYESPHGPKELRYYTEEDMAMYGKACVEEVSRFRAEGGNTKPNSPEFDGISLPSPSTRGEPDTETLAWICKQFGWRVDGNNNVLADRIAHHVRDLRAGIKARDAVIAGGEPATDSAGRAAMKLALAALEVATTPMAKDRQTVLRAQTTLLAALAASEPAPVAREVLAAAEAVVARWDSPKWKDEAPTADYIARLRRAIARATAESAPASAAPDEQQKELPPVYAQALDLVHEAGYASVSMVQRRLRIGWNAARDLIVLMHERSEIPDAWLPPAALIGMRAPSNTSPAGAKEQDK